MRRAGSSAAVVLLAVSVLMGATACHKFTQFMKEYWKDPYARPQAPAPTIIRIVGVEDDSLKSRPIEIWSYKIVKTYPHDPGAFTQGLVYDNGFFYESTGRYGSSELRKVEPETGKVVKRYSLPGSYFGEGLTLLENGSLLQLTWHSGVGVVYDKGSFAVKGEFYYDGEGWGITGDGKSLIMSDGSATLSFRDPATFEEQRRVTVRNLGVPVLHLNELEYVKGEIFANIWGEELIAVISPESGRVTRWIDLSGLHKELGDASGADVLNGIAYDAARDRLFVTGKFWPKLFQIELAPAGSKVPEE